MDGRKLESRNGSNAKTLSCENQVDLLIWLVLSIQEFVLTSPALRSTSILMSHYENGKIHHVFGVNMYSFVDMICLYPFTGCELPQSKLLTC